MSEYTLTYWSLSVPFVYKEEEPQQYLLFTYEDYYPQGGWNDFSGFFPSFETAKKYAEKLSEDWDMGGGADIVEREMLEVVGRGEYKCNYMDKRWKWKDE